MFEHLSDEEVLQIKDVMIRNKELDPMIEEHIFIDIEIIRLNVKHATNILKKYELYGPEYAIKLISLLTDNNINITYRELPSFKEFVMNYGPLLRRIRSLSIRG